MKPSGFRANEFSDDRERQGDCQAAPCKKMQKIIRALTVSDGLTGSKMSQIRCDQAPIYG